MKPERIAPTDARCLAHVYRRDTWRRTGRGRTGFEMHYNREQCRRRGTGKPRLCGPHAKIHAAHPSYLSLEVSA